MEPDDWKILTQGGMTAHDRKYKTSSLKVIRCPMFITCQTDMDFGKHHNTAVEARLRKVFFKSLTAPRVAGVQEFLRDSAMDCIVWASGLARTPDDELPPPFPSTSVLPEDIDEEEKERISTIQLDESESRQEGSDEAEVNTTTQFSDQERESEDSDAESTYLGQWERSLKNIELQREQKPCHSLKQR